MTILVTGAAGFIGSAVCRQLLQAGNRVVGIDNLNDYYDIRFKRHRLEEFRSQRGFRFEQADIENVRVLRRIFARYRFSAVINLAARAGVRYSLENPWVYQSTNATGMLNILVLSHEFGVQKIVQASTSSLYAGQKMPFKESLAVNAPISPYAASKKGAEALCYTYHYLHDLDVTILRYFTVYGPAGRPDMSPFRFIKWIDEGKPLQIFGDGKQSRDFTYVDDIARGTILATKLKGFQTINLGSNRPFKLMEFIRMIESELGKKAKFKFLPKNKTDMDATWADIGLAKRLLGWKPMVSLEEGVKRTVEWYLAQKKWAGKIKV